MEKKAKRVEEPWWWMRMKIDGEYEASWNQGEDEKPWKRPCKKECNGKKKGEAIWF